MQLNPNARLEGFSTHYAENEVCNILLCIQKNRHCAFCTYVVGAYPLGLFGTKSQIQKNEEWYFVTKIVLA